MSKLLKLKKWLTLDDAARRIGIMCGENVVPADVLQLGLDGHLTLSIQLVNSVYARPCIPVDLEEIEYIDFPAMRSGDQPTRIPANGRVWRHDDGTFYQVVNSVVSLQGVLDLPLFGGERCDVEHLYQYLTNGPAVTAVSLDGIFVRSPSGDLYEIHVPYERSKQLKLDVNKPWLHPDNFHPAGALPEDGVLVVRAVALEEFEQVLQEGEGVGITETEEKQLGTRERNGLLKALAAICSYAGLDFNKPAKTAALLRREAELKGWAIGETTIENHLKAIPEALKTRVK